MINSRLPAPFERQALYDQADAYLAALAARDASRLPWAKHVVFTENNVQLALGDGAWNTVTAVRGGYNLKCADPETGQVAWFGVVEERGDVQTGVQIVKRALEEPLRQLATNAGEDGSVVVQNVRRMQKENESVNYGFEVLSGQYVNLLEKGITDPAKVVRSALENASSIASMILTTEALITDIPEKEPAMPGGPGGMGGMDY